IPAVAVVPARPGDGGRAQLSLHILVPRIGPLYTHHRPGTVPAISRPPPRRCRHGGFSGGHYLALFPGGAGVASGFLRSERRGIRPRGEKQRTAGGGPQPDPSAKW